MPQQLFIQAINDVGGRADLFGMSAVLVVIGVWLIALAPAERSARQIPASAL